MKHLSLLILLICSQLIINAQNSTAKQFKVYTVGKQKLIIKDNQLFQLNSDGSLLEIKNSGLDIQLGSKNAWSYYEPVIKQESISKQILDDNTPATLKKAELESQTVVQGISKRLEKKVKNLAKCDMQLVSNGKKLILKTIWKIETQAATWNFGYITKNSTLSLLLSNGKEVVLHYNKFCEPKEYEKYDLSIYSNELELNQEQIRMLMSGYLKSATMKWGRRTETYDIFTPDYFIKELPKIVE